MVFTLLMDKTLVHISGHMLLESTKLELINIVVHVIQVTMVVEMLPHLLLVIITTVSLVLILVYIGHKFSMLMTFCGMVSTVIVVKLPVELRVCDDDSVPNETHF